MAARLCCRGRRVARATAEQAQPVEPTRHVEAAHHPHPRGGQFDRQRQTVEPAADLGDRADRLMIEVEIRPACPGPLGEQSRRVVDRQRRNRQDPLALHPERFPTRCQHDDVRTVPNDLVDQPRGRIKDVLAVVHAEIAACASAGTRSRLLRCRGPGAAAASVSRQRRALTAEPSSSGASSQNHAPSSNCSSSRPATSRASRVFPTPPTPVSVTSGPSPIARDDACDVVLASDEAGDAPRHAAARSSGDRNLRCGRYDMVSGIAVEDQLVHLAQRRARVGTQLLDESFAHRAECLERVGLSATTVLGQHQLTGKPLVERMV